MLYETRMFVRNNNDLNEVKELLCKFELEYEKDIDYTIGLYDNNKLIGTGSKSKNIIKCIAILDEYQNEDLLSKIMTELINKLFEEEIYHYFIFTKELYKRHFQSFSFNEIITYNGAILMESGNYSIDEKLIDMKEKYKLTETYAAVVVNCNPFTNGHKFLIEKASVENKNVLVFVVQEDKSYFTFKDRYEMVKEGTKHLSNVLVVPSTEYMISSATFPTYFIKNKNDKIKTYTNIDALIFLKYFAKTFNITRRYVGEEPFCELTSEYNKTLKDVFHDKIELIEVPRQSIDGIAISASYVRKQLETNKYEELEKIVPESTLRVLEKFMYSN